VEFSYIMCSFESDGNAGCIPFFFFAFFFFFLFFFFFFFFFYKFVFCFLVDLITAAFNGPNGPS
jgi:hypothetical protein